VVVAARATSAPARASNTMGNPNFSLSVPGLQTPQEALYRALGFVGLAARAASFES
jgi:hypothetical protein